MSNTNERLKSFVERIERMEAEKYKEEMMLLETYASAIQMELFA